MTIMPSDLTIEEQAHWWVEWLRLPDVERHAAFIAWLRTSPLHVREFSLAYANELLEPAMQAIRAYRKTCH